MSVRFTATQWLAAGSFALGAALMILAATIAVGRARKRRRFVKIEGDVVAMTQGDDAADAGGWVPVVRYVRPDGREREIVGREFVDLASFGAQERLIVLFDPRAPDDPWLERDFAEAAPLAYFLVADVFFCIAIMLYFAFD